MHRIGQSLAFGAVAIVGNLRKPHAIGRKSPTLNRIRAINRYGNHRGNAPFGNVQIQRVGKHAINRNAFHPRISGQPCSNAICVNIEQSGTRRHRSQFGKLIAGKMVRARNGNLFYRKCTRVREHKPTYAKYPQQHRNGDENTHHLSR